MPIFDFTDEALATITTALPNDAPPERVSLLPDILRAWAKEDLREHFSRKGRAALCNQGDQLVAVKKTARALVEAVCALDPDILDELACRTQARREAKVVTTRSGARFEFADVEEARRRCDHALSWVADLTPVLDEPEAKSPPDKKTRNYLIVLDLAAIFELVTFARPTRRIDPVTSKPYGPFTDFVNAVCDQLPNVRSRDRAIRDVMRFYPAAVEGLAPVLRDQGRKEYPAFVANLQFRDPVLWQKLKRTRLKF